MTTARVNALRILGESTKPDYQFLEWFEQDHSRALLLGPSNERKVMVLHLPHLRRLQWLPSALPLAKPRLLTPVHLMIPPWRSTKAEADLIREFRSIYHEHADDAWEKRFYIEGRRRGITRLEDPEPWEFFHQTVLHPDPLSEPLLQRGRVESNDDTAKAVEKWRKNEKAMRSRWFERERLNPEDLESQQRRFWHWLASSSSSNVLYEGERKIACAQVRFRLDYANHDSVWLAGFDIRDAIDGREREAFADALKAHPDLETVSPREAEAWLTQHIETAKGKGGDTNPNRKRVGPKARKAACIACGIDHQSPIPKSQLPLLLNEVRRNRKRPKSKLE